MLDQKLFMKLQGDWNEMDLQGCCLWQTMAEMKDRITEHFIKIKIRRCCFHMPMCRWSGGGRAGNFQSFWLADQSRMQFLDYDTALFVMFVMPWFITTLNTIMLHTFSILFFSHVLLTLCQVLCNSHISACFRTLMICESKAKKKRRGFSSNGLMTAWH